MAIIVTLSVEFQDFMMCGCEMDLSGSG